MMASRKAVLDKNKQQLLDSVNAANKIYNNEELSILVQNMQQEIATLKDQNQSLIDKNTVLEQFKSKQEKRNSQVPIGEYDLFIGNYLTTETSYQLFGASYFPSTRILDTLGWSPSKKVKICVVGSTTARGSHDNTYAYVKIGMGSEELEMTWATWGSTNIGQSVVNCTEISNSYLDTKNNPHWYFYARTNSSSESIRLYRIYLLAYEA